MDPMLTDHPRRRRFVFFSEARDRGGGKPDERELVDFDDFVGEECGGARADTSNGIQRNRCLTCHHSYECAFSIGFRKRGYQYLPNRAE